MVALLSLLTHIIATFIVAPIIVVFAIFPIANSSSHFFQLFGELGGPSKGWF